MAGDVDLAPVARTGTAGATGSLQRALAIALLPASILPVVLFGPALLRAPEKLWREARAEVQRLQEPAQAPRARERHTP
jgi:hypothetical protein